MCVFFLFSFAQHSNQITFCIRFWLWYQTQKWCKTESQLSVVGPMEWSKTEKSTIKEKHLSNITFFRYFTSLREANPPTETSKQQYIIRLLTSNIASAVYRSLPHCARETELSRPMRMTSCAPWTSSTTRWTLRRRRAQSEQADHEPDTKLPLSLDNALHAQRARHQNGAEQGEQERNFIG